MFVTSLADRLKTVWLYRGEGGQDNPDEEEDDEKDEENESYAEYTDAFTEQALRYAYGQVEEYSDHEIYPRVPHLRASARWYEGEFKTYRCELHLKFTLKVPEAFRDEMYIDAIDEEEMDGKQLLRYLYGLELDR